MASLLQLQLKNRTPRVARVELARMFWRASFYVRRQRPRDEYTNELLAYLEREFQVMWQRAEVTGYRDDPAR